MNKLLAGALSGFAATLPMTAVMQFLHRYPVPERDHLPPHQITSRIASRIGLKRQLSQPQLNATVLVTHFGFGALGGTVYALLLSKLPFPTAVKGALWGLTIWFLSYMEWIPAINLLPPASKHSKRRLFMMIAAHLVWGVSMAKGVEALDRSF